MTLRMMWVYCCARSQMLLSSLPFQAEGKVLDVKAAKRSIEAWCRARSSGQDAGELLRQIVDPDRLVWVH